MDTANQMYKILQYFVCQGYYRDALSVLQDSNDLNNYNVNYLLVLSIAYNQLHMVELLVSYGAETNYKDSYCLKLACILGRTRAVELLLQTDVDINASNGYPLSVACANGHMPIVKVLLRHGVDINANNDHALRWAHSNKQTQVVHFLVSQGADPSAIINRSESPYILSCQLLQHGFFITRTSTINGIPNTSCIEITAENF